MRALWALAVVVLLGAGSSAPTLHRVDSNEVAAGDGPVLVTVRSSAFADERSDRFSARLIPDGETGADWQPCTTASSAFCHYEASGNGLRILRFAALDDPGHLEIRYAVGDGPTSEALAIDIGPAPAQDTLDSISQSFGASPPPKKPHRVTLELRIDAGGHTSAEGETKPQAAKPVAQKPPDAKPPVARATARPHPPSGPEFVHVTCSSVPLYADEHGTPILAAGTVLVARAGDVFLAQRGAVSGRTGSLRVLDLGARVYIDAGCVR